MTKSKLYKKAARPPRNDVKIPKMKHNFGPVRSHKLVGGKMGAGKGVKKLSR